MLSSFLSIASVTAMDSSKTEQEIAATHMKRAYAALDIVNARQEEDKCRGGSKRFDWYGCSSISSYFGHTNRDDLFIEFEKSENSDLLVIAEHELNLALVLGDPYAASVLKQIYTTEETKDKLIEALATSVQMKKERGIVTGLNQDVDLLLTAKGISSKTLDGIEHIREIDPDRAIACYGYMASDLSNIESSKAFDALIALQESPNAWFHIAKALFSRDRVEEGLKWVENIVTRGIANDNVLSLLESRSENEKLHLSLRLRAARLAHQYAQKNSNKIEIIFSPALKYYKLLRIAKSRGEDVSEFIMQVGPLLAKIADESRDPQFLFQFALTQEESVNEGDDRSAIIDMYRRAADMGSYEAVEKFATSPYLIETLGAVDAVSFLIQHQQKLAFLNLYEDEKTSNPVYLIILSLLLESKDYRQDEELGQKVASLLEAVDSSYAPANDLKIRKLTKALNSHLRFVQDASERIYYAFDYYCQSSVFIPTDAYHHGGYKFTNKEDASDFVSKLKIISEEKQKEISELAAQRDVLIGTLSALDLFNLAQENDLVNRACEIMFKSDYSRPKSYYQNFVLMLEKSAEKGFLPAVAQLIDLYTDGYLKKNYDSYTSFKKLNKEERVGQSPEKAAFYQAIQAILTNTTLGVIEQADLLKKAFEPANPIEKEMTSPDSKDLEKENIA